ncbi:MAG: threonine-phosphate decarboxylase CobD [Eubacteriales bacterium]|nr:threonine-phosphate decarboxylase CobD [Eubacteriales bacterium]
MAVHGGDIYGEELQELAGTLAEGVLDFSANINPLGMPESVRRAVTDALSAAEHYPDPKCRKLRAALSAEHGVPAERILCGNGGAELIYRLAYALRPKKALLTVPTFSEYEEALRQTGADFVFYEMESDLRVREDILERMDPSVDVVFLCNPNNPTGILTGRELLLRMLERAKELGTLLVLDECFLDFTGREELSLLPLAAECPSLFVLRSFTKMYAMPGLRLGYGVCGDRELLARMEAAGPCWNVSVPASEAGVAALGEREYRRRAVELVRRERRRMKERLEALGLKVWDGQADYLFFRAEGVEDLYERLLPHGILIRRCGNYRGLGPWDYRAAVKGRDDNERFLKAMEEVLA